MVSVSILTPTVGQKSPSPMKIILRPSFVGFTIETTDSLQGNGNQFLPFGREAETGRNELLERQ